MDTLVQEIDRENREAQQLELKHRDAENEVRKEKQKADQLKSDLDRQMQKVAQAEANGSAIKLQLDQLHQQKERKATELKRVEEKLREELDAIKK